MLSDEVLELVSERLVNRIENANEYILKTIGNNLDELGKLSYDDAHKLAQMMKYGGDYDKIVKKLAKITDLNEKDIIDIFDEVATSDYEFAKQFYDYKNIKYTPYDENIALKSQVDAITSITQREIRNMMNPSVLGYGMVDNATGQVTFKGLKQAYYDLIDEAVLSVGQGKETFNEAMSRQIKAMGGGGLKVVYDSTYVDKNGIVKNRTRRLDSSIRMNMKDGLRTLHNETQDIFGKQFGADGVEVSVHQVPAPDHAEMQGRQFSKEEYNKLQLDGIAKDYKGKLIDITHTSKKGKVSHRPVSQYNCYHYIFNIVLGVSSPEYTDKQLQEIIDESNEKIEIDGKEYTKYECTQLQRSLETRIREQKDTQIFAKSSGNNYLVGETQNKISMLSNKYKEISDIAGLPTKMDRLKVNGYKRSSEGNIAYKKEIGKAKIGTFDASIFGKEFKPTTKDLILTQERKNHIFKNHPKDAPIYFDRMQDVLKNYDGAYKELGKKSTIWLVKNYDDYTLKLAIKINEMSLYQKKELGYKNSVITFHPIRKNTIRNSKDKGKIKALIDNDMFK